MTWPQDSTVPAVLDWLETNAATALPDTYVKAGVVKREQVKQYSALFFGAGRAVEVTSKPLGRNSSLETYSVACRCWARTGTKDYAAMRAAVTAILSWLRALIMADPTLGGLVLNTTFGTALAWTQDLAGDGVAVQVDFSIKFKAAC